MTNRSIQHAPEPSPIIDDGNSAVRTREPRALRDLFLTYHDAVWRLLRRLGVHEAHVDDCLQEVFWVAARRFDDIAPGRHRAFLYGVALRVASQMVRGQQASALQLAPQPVEQIDPTPSPEVQMQDQQARALLDRVLAAMPSPQREIFVLFELQGLRAQDIAQIYDLPVGTVTSRLRRAREAFSAAASRLRATLERMEGS